MKKNIILQIFLLSTFPLFVMAGNPFMAQAAAGGPTSYAGAMYNYERGIVPTVQSCPPCTSNQGSNSPNGTANNYIPTFVVQFNSANGTMLRQHTFNTPTTFLLNTAIFEVNIFPASNSINGSTIKYSTAEQGGTYIIGYTLKDPAGTQVHKEFDQEIQFTSALPAQITLIQNPNAPITNTQQQMQQQQMQQGQGQTPSIPTAATWTPSQTPIGNNASALAQAIFLPMFSGSTAAAAQQQIVNSCAPISQQFLFTQNNGSISATSLSGTMLADNNAQQGQYNLASAPFGQVTPTTGKPIGGITIMINDNSFIVFDNKDGVLNQADLQNGLSLSLTFFPTAQTKNYPVVAVLKTIDGLKMIKKSVIYDDNPMKSTVKQPTNYLQSVPVSLGLQYTPSGGQATPLITTSLFSSNAATAATAAQSGASGTASGYAIMCPAKFNFFIAQSSSDVFMTSIL